MKKFSNYINGSWKAPSTGKYYTKSNPADPREKLGEFPLSDENDVNDAVSAASNATKNWSQITGPNRAELLYQFADLLIREKDELAKIITLEQGKTLIESKGEVVRAVRETRYIAGEANRIIGQTFPSEYSNITSQTILEPIGVVAAISPWNFPVVTPVRKIAPALAFGNTVVFKPASDTPYSAIRLVELFEEAGFPKGVVNLIIGDGKTVGNFLINDVRINGISFTGSTDIGLRVYEAAAQRNAKVQLELGGKNPVIVWNYSDLDYAADEIVKAAFLCSGQRCTALSRVIVSEEQGDFLVDKLAERIEDIKVGNGLDKDITMGPLISESHFKTVEAYVNQGKESGSKLVVGGYTLVKNYNREGYFFSPTLFDEVNEQSALARDEIFGPVLPVLRVKEFDDAIRVANDSQYGLASSLFCDDMNHVNRFTKQMKTGMVHINHGTASQAHVPFGGVKLSGQGAYSIGPSVREFYSNIKTIYIAWESS